MLTVAVSITAGVSALTSAFPALLPHRVTLCLAAIALIAWANLRGVRESGTLFAVPTYGFVLIVTTLIAVGLVRLAAGRWSASPVHPLPGGGAPTEQLTWFLVLRAFSSGCAALTGIEAISNGVLAFRKPEAQNAGRTLVVMAVLLVAMFLGITYLARALTVVPVEAQTVLSQIGRQVFTSGPLYLAPQVLTALILILAANTSFAGFPRVAAVLARDRYLPSQLTSLGDRLVFANGIATLGILASALVVILGAQTHRLIPLYAAGVFLSFTLSQAGMVRHWLRRDGQGWRWKAAINGLGALATGLVSAVFVATKFIHGAWVVILLTPVFVWTFHKIRWHYSAVADQLSLDGMTPTPWSGVASHSWYRVVVPVSGMHRGTLATLRFARALSKDVMAVIVDVDPQVTARVRDKWALWGQGVPLVVLESPYRSTIRPLLAYLEQMDPGEPGREAAVVVLPEFIPARWWHHLLHNQTALLLKMVLTYRRGQTANGRVIINVPYQLRD